MADLDPNALTAAINAGLSHPTVGDGMIAAAIRAYLVTANPEPVAGENEAWKAHQRGSEYSFPKYLSRYPNDANNFRAALRIAIAANQKPTPMHFTTKDVQALYNGMPREITRILRSKGATADWSVKETE